MALRTVLCNTESLFLCIYGYLGLLTSFHCEENMFLFNLIKAWKKYGYIQHG